MSRADPFLFVIVPAAIIGWAMFLWWVVGGRLRRKPKPRPVLQCHEVLVDGRGHSRAEAMGDAWGAARQFFGHTRFHCPDAESGVQGRMFLGTQDQRGRTTDREYTISVLYREEA